MTRRRELFAVTLVLLLAALVRIINIDGPALWTDEGFTYYTFKIDLFEALVNDRHPPFYFYTLHAWEALAGDSILALRWWSFLPSLLTIAIGVQIGRELLKHRPGLAAQAGWLSLPVLAALMLALADGENYLAQELRMYTWHTCFAAASLWLYLRYTRRGTWRAALPWVVASALLIHTHYFGAYVLAAQGLHTLIFLRGRVRIGAVGALALAGVLFLPWFLGVTLQQFAQDDVCVNCPTPDNWPRLLEFRELWFGQQWPLTMLLAAFGFVTVAYKRDGNHIAWRWGLFFLLAALVVIPISVTYVLGHEEDIFFAHRLSQITIPITLLLALGLANLNITARWVIVLALLLYGVTTIDWYRIKVPWDEITAIVAQYAEADELVLGEVGPEESALLYYLDHMLPPGTTISTYPFWADLDRFTYYEEQLPALIDDHQSAWVIDFTPDDGAQDKLTAAGYQQTMRQEFQHVGGSIIEIYRYDRLPDAARATFENGMTLHQAEINPENLRVDLWWSADSALDRDYVVSAFLLDESGQLVAQYDSPPVEGTRPTTTWQQNDVLYDPRSLEPANDETLPPGSYTAAVQIYAFKTDGSIQPVMLADGEPYLTLGSITR